MGSSAWDAGPLLKPDLDRRSGVEFAPMTGDSGPCVCKWFANEASAGLYPRPGAPADFVGQNMIVDEGCGPLTADQARVLVILDAQVEVLRFLELAHA